VALVVRDRAGLGPVDLVARVDLDPVDLDPVDMRGRVGPDLEDLAVRRPRDPVDMRGRVGLYLEDLAVRRRRDPVDLVDTRGQLGLDLAVRHRRDPVDMVARADLDPVDMRGRVGLGVRDRQDRVDLAARAALDLVDPVDLAGRVDMDPVDRRRTHPGVRTSGVALRWAAPGMRRTASAHPTTVRRLHRDNMDSAGMVGLLPERRRGSGTGRRPRVAGAVRRLPVVGTAHGMVRRVTGATRSVISGRSITTATTRSRCSIRYSADGASGSSESGFRCTDTT
jgi:hypothetical protein